MLSWGSILSHRMVSCGFIVALMWELFHSIPIYFVTANSKIGIFSQGYGQIIGRGTILTPVSKAITEGSFQGHLVP